MGIISEQIDAEVNRAVTAAMSMVSKDNPLRSDEYYSRRQLNQVLAPHSGFSEKSLSDAIQNSKSPYSPLLPLEELSVGTASKPIRAFGETENRIPSGLPSPSQNVSVIDSITDNLDKYVTVDQREVDAVATSLYTKISVATNFKEVIPEGLDGITVKNIRLPYDVCWFELAYLDKPVNILVTQDKDTQDLLYIDKENGAVFYSLLASRHINLGEYGLLEKEKCKDYELDIITACMAMDASGLADTIVLQDLKLPAAPAKLNRSIVKRTIVVKFEKTTSLHNKNTGRRSPRQHWRRGYFRIRLGMRQWVKPCIVSKGKIGIVIKNYTLK